MNNFLFLKCLIHITFKCLETYNLFAWVLYLLIGKEMRGRIKQSLLEPGFICQGKFHRGGQFEEYLEDETWN